MRRWLLVVGVLCSASVANAADTEVWSAYLDYAYVYSSAEPDALRARLDGYGREAGMSLDEYVSEYLETPGAGEGEADQAAVRRRAVAQLLHYLAKGEPDSLDRSAKTIRGLREHLGRHENRYWYHYIMAHRALERGHTYDFVGEVLDLWLKVVVPLEAPYETLETLSLSDSPNSGFMAALPYIYENTARMILIRSQQLGISDHLDPLGALVRLLGDGRVGAHPDVIPVEASSLEYVQRIVERLDGSESDAGSLTFTLALFEASKYHEDARARLAADGLSADTLEAIRIAAGAYETALNRASTEQGRAAVYTRVLRQLGEVYAAKRRLGVDPDVDTPFSIEGAIDVYSILARADEEDEEWKDFGYTETGRQSYVDAMHRLWEEIQETILNAADFYLTRSIEQPHMADDHSRNAARLFARYLSFFHEFATTDKREAVPDSAYFAAYEAARGFGDAYVVYGPGNPKPTEVELAAKNYLRALKLYPFDRHLFSSLTAALERSGRGNGYLNLARPVAEAVARSRSVDRWIEQREAGAQRIEKLRRALSDGVVLMYLGFAEASGIEELEASLVTLQAERDAAEQALVELNRRREDLAAGGGEEAVPAAFDADADAEGDDVDGAYPMSPAARLRGLEREIEAASERLEKFEKQLAARSRALPLYKATLETDDLADELRAQRDHPVHTLLRRMYHENRS